MLRPRKNLGDREWLSSNFELLKRHLERMDKHTDAVDGLLVQVERALDRVEEPKINPTDLEA